MHFKKYIYVFFENNKIKWTSGYINQKVTAKQAVRRLLCPCVGFSSYPQKKKQFEENIDCNEGTRGDQREWLVTVVNVFRCTSCCHSLVQLQPHSFLFSFVVH